MAPTDRPNPKLEGSWRDQASCYGQPHQWWFPERTQGYTHEPGPAEEICSICPVFDECCLAGSNEPDGIWAGELKASPRRR